MRLAIVTPVRNGAHLIESTIHSVVSQQGLSSGEHELDYLVWDADSVDGTAQRAEAASQGRARVVSQRDTGMYDGLAQALRMVDGDVMCYLNAGDLMQPGALLRLAALFADPALDWLCGLHLYYAPTGEIVGARLPFRYRRDMIQRGYYGRGLPTIQQESTYWRPHLLDAIDYERFASYKLAGDFYLWHSFSRIAEPVVAQVGLAGFRYHGDHLSEARAAYRRELDDIAGPLRPWAKPQILKERALWHLPRRLTSRWTPSTLAFDADRGWSTGDR